MYISRLAVFSFLILAGNPLVAEMRYDQKTMRYSSTPVSNEINQEEYHNHVVQVALFFAQNNTKPFEQNFVLVSAYLRMVGTPAALRLLDDYKLILKNAMTDTLELELMPNQVLKK